MQIYVFCVCTDKSEREKRKKERVAAIYEF